MSKQNSKQITEEQWVSVKLGDLVTTVNENEYNPIENGFSKYVAGEHIESDRIYITKYGDIETNKEIIGSAFHKVFHKGEILFGTRRAYLRKAGIATFDGICSNTTLVLKAKNQKYSELIPFLLHWENFQKYAISKSVGSTNPYVRWRDLEKFEFNLPLNTTKKISDFLWSIQNTIISLEILLSKFLDYKKSKREFLITHGINHDKFRNPQKENKPYRFKSIPTTWDYLPLGDKQSGEFINGLNKNKDDYGYGCLHVNIDNIFDGFEIISSTLGKVDATPGEIIRYGLQKGDICLLRSSVKASNIGYPILFNGFDEPVVFSGFIIRFRPNPNFWNSEFLVHLLRSKKIRDNVIAWASVSANTNINQDSYSKILVPHPPSLQEQQKIASYLTKIDNTISDIKQNIDNLYSIRKNMINSLFSQKIKLKEDFHGK